MKYFTNAKEKSTVIKSLDVTRPALMINIPTWKFGQIFRSQNLNSEQSDKELSVFLIKWNIVPNPNTTIIIIKTMENNMLLS